MKQLCPICNENIKIFKTDSSNKIECPKCGHFKLSDEMITYIKEYINKKEFYKLSSWIKESNDDTNSKLVPLIDKERFEKLLKYKNKRVIEKFDKMIDYLSNYPINTQINENIIVSCWMKNRLEFDILYQKAIDRGFIEKIDSKTEEKEMPTFSKFTYDGLEYLESIELDPNKHKDGIFVAYNFTDELNQIFENDVRNAINEMGFEYIKVDQNTTDCDQKITDEIIAKLKSARMIIADFTNHSSNVYFEAGFAMGLKIPVIWTCKKDHEDKLSFDTGQYPHIVWEDKEELKKQIKNRMKSIV